MLLDKVFEPFVKAKPLWVMARAVLQRLLDPQHLDQLFARTAQRQYTHELLFFALVDLRSRVVLGQEPSVHATYRTLEDQDQEQLVVRRITVALDQPTREGDTAVHVLTNLPANKASAVRVAAVYCKRWTIEGLFFEAAQTLSCEIDTLCYPKAALFAFCLGLLASNAVALVKAALRAEQGEKVVRDKLSAYDLVLEIRQTYAGMMVAIPPPQWSVF